MPSQQTLEFVLMYLNKPMQLSRPTTQDEQDCIIDENWCPRRRSHISQIWATQSGDIASQRQLCMHGSCNSLRCFQTWTIHRLNTYWVDWGSKVWMRATNHMTSAQARHQTPHSTRRCCPDLPNDASGRMATVMNAMSTLNSQLDSTLEEKQSLETATSYFVFLFLPMH